MIFYFLLDSYLELYYKVIGFCCCCRDIYFIVNINKFFVVKKKNIMF